MLHFRPVLILPSPDQFTIAVRFCPLLFELRESKVKPTIPLPYRMIFAVATKCSVYLYDTQQKLPFGLISNIHYTRLTDLAWSNDGKILMVSSTDGYCSIVQFADGELGKTYKEQSIQDILKDKMAKEEQPKKKKKKAAKKQIAKVEDKIVNENQGNDDAKDAEKMEVQVESPASDIAIENLPESKKDIIPVDKIIKSNELFSPEKQVGSPVTPIQVRKCPRLPDELKDSTENDKKATPGKNENAPTTTLTTPKASTNSKTPNRIEIRRFPRSSFQPASIVNSTAAKDDESTWPKPIFSTDSPIERKLSHAIETAPISPSPKTPGRRVQLQTITTPKSKKKIL